MTQNKLQKNIPEGWEWKTLGDIGKCIRGVSYAPGDLSAKKNDSNTFLLRSNNIKDSHLNLDNVNIVNSAKIKDEQILQKGDFFICMSNGSKDLVGKNVAYYGEEKYTVGSFCAIYRPNNLEQEKFLTHFFHSQEYSEQIKNALAGTSINNLKNSNIEDLKILMPPIKERAKLSDILGNIDEQIEKVNEVIKKTEELKKGLMQELFTKGIGHTKFKKTKLGMIPEELSIVNFGSFTNHVGSGATPRGGDKIYKKEGILFLRSQNVYFDGLRLEDVAYIPKDVHLSMKRSTVFPRDVLLNITGASIGRASLVPEEFPEANVNQHVCIIRVDEKIYPNYLFYFLQSNFGQDQIARFQIGGNREGLNFQQIRSMQMMLPKKEEQIEIAKILSNVDEKNSINKQIKEKLTELKKGLMRDLLSGRVRVI